MIKRSIAYHVNMHVDNLSCHNRTIKELCMLRRPLETRAQMMLKLIACSLYAEQELKFASSKCREPQLSIQSKDGDTKLWIEFGLVNAKRLYKLCNLAEEVVLFTQNDKAAMHWKERTLNKLHPLHNLTVIHICDEVLASAAKLVTREMSVKALIEQGQLSFSIEEKTIVIEPQHWKVSGI